MKVQAIDTHCHIHYSPKESLPPNTLTDLMREGSCYTAYWEGLAQIGAAAGVGAVMASPFEALLDRACTEQANEVMLALAGRTPSLYQWVVIDPQNDATLAQAERMLESEKCVGIKLHPVCHKYSLAQYGDKLFSFAAARSAVVQIHPEGAADDILPFANRYPRATFIMAHLGDERHIAAVRGAKHGNVYVDTSGRASLKNMLIEHAVGQIGSERILFGTDTYAAGAQRGRIEYAMIEQKDKENILFYNAKRLFGL